MNKSRIRKYIGILTLAGMITSLIAGCGHRKSDLDQEMEQYIHDKYGVDVTIIRSSDLHGRTGYDNSYYGTTYVVESDDREFNIEYDKRNGFKDDYLLADIEDDFMDAITDSFGRSVVNSMDVSINMQMVDDSVCSLRDLADSDASVSISVFCSGVELDSWMSFDVTEYSENTSLYVNDFVDSNLPDRRITSVGGETVAGVSSGAPDKGDYCLYNYSACFDSANSEWSSTEYETLEMDGMIITYDRNSNVCFERIDNTLDSSLPAYRVTLDSSSFVEFIVDGGVAISGSIGSALGARPAELESIYYIHDQGRYRIDITVESSMDIIFEAV